MDASAFAKAKVDLKGRLDDLRDQLDRYLAGEYGIVKDRDTASYEQVVREPPAPFTGLWNSYGIMYRRWIRRDYRKPTLSGNTGGTVRHQNTLPLIDSRAIHATVHRAKCRSRCKNDGCLSMIVPLALVSTQSA